MSQFAPTQTDLLCEACAGQSSFDPDAGGLLCASCGTVRSLESERDSEAATERPIDPDASEDEPFDTLRHEAHLCESCGGRVVFSGNSLSDRCPYCDGPIVRAMDADGYSAMALIPFRVDRRRALAAAALWTKRRWAAPMDLQDAVSQGRTVGIYVPFWTFDSEEFVEFHATYRVNSGKRMVVRSTQGKLKIDFDDLLVPASPHVTPLIRDGILHEFRPSRLRAFKPGYLAGFAAERHHMSVAGGLEANRSQKDLLIRNRIKEYVNDYATKVVSYRTDSSGLRYRRILLPVWILHYSYGGQPRKIVVSGIDGRTFGERPFSRAKLLVYSGIVTALVMAFGLIWGAWGAV